MVKRHVLQVIAKPDYLLHDAKIYRVEAEQRVTEYRDQQEGLITSLIKLEQEEARVLAGYQKGVYRDEPQLLEQLASIRSQQEETRTTLNSFEAHDQELTKAERVRLLSDQVVQMHAYQGNLGVFSRPKRKGWVDAALADLEQRETIDVVIPGDEDEPWVTQSVPLNEWWKDTIATLVNRIWVEDDGSLKIEGVIEVANGQVTADNPPR
jgi:cytochrome c biogenesis protein ResB